MLCPGRFILVESVCYAPDGLFWLNLYVIQRLILDKSVNGNSMEHGAATCLFLSLIISVYINPTVKCPKYDTHIEKETYIMQV